MAQTGSPSWNLLTGVFGDPATRDLLSEDATIEAWLAAERALARAEADVGLLTDAEAAAIETAAVLDSIDRAELWAQTRNVGYPILPLIRMIAAQLPAGPAGRVHFGATTQDIMDTGLVLQLRAVLARLAELMTEFGDALARLTREHTRTVLAARTHAQQAVPTTFGAKMAVYLAELTRHRERLDQLGPRLGAVSLYGAGGTSAALGQQAVAVREAMARRLGLAAPVVPWHVARDSLAEFGQVCALLSATAARFAGEVIALSRTEIGEVAEEGGHHRGASSTMPQKANPIGSEVTVGLAASAAALLPSVYRAMTAPHERAAGEWQIEWFALPQLAELSAGAVANVGRVAAGLQVFPDRMRANLAADGGLIMAESVMFRLAPALGREAAHDLVYGAAREARASGTSLLDALRPLLPPGRETLLDDAHAALAPEAYTGDPVGVCNAALAMWASYP
jgi:3-carboxy-cis,cis-muconate cycloisomerase